MSAISLLVFWLMVATGQAQAQSTINLSLHKNISKQAPALGDVLTYTVVVANAAGSATATNVVIQDDLPVGGVAYVPNSASTIHGLGTYTTAGSATATVGTWTIPSLAPGDSAVLVLQATVLQRGVWFNKAEVIAADQPDFNSIPNNHSLVEDDYVTVCFSVPIHWYAGDEFTVTVPAGFNQIVWYRNNVPISSSAVSTSLVEVNADSSLTIKSPGTYRFVTYATSCPATNCCDIQVIQGPYGSLGDYVFIDANKNGAQDSGDTGLNGVKVYLYDLAGTTRLDSTVTAGNGKYLFDSLTDGSYTIKFIAPTGYQSTSANAAGVPDSLDSDVGTDGFTDIYTVDTSQPESSTARNNLTVDAGFYLPSATLGNYVFVDVNKNGIMDAGDSPLPGVVVVLLDGTNTAVASMTTNASGFYSFTGLTPGVAYSVKFIMPAGYSSTTALVGGDDSKDSDADPVTGQTRSVTLAAGEVNNNIGAGFFLPSASLGDYIFVDANKNGIQDRGDSPLPGVVVTLLDGNNMVVASTASTASGLYSFTGLTPGVPYSVSFVSPTGYTSTSAQVGGDDMKDSDADPVTGQTRSVTLSPGENNLNLDAGFQPACPTDYSLIVSNNTKICIGDSTKLIASTQLQHAKICYFLTPTGGAPFAIVDSGDPVTVKPSTTTTYYVEVTLNGCESPRTPISVTVTATPTPTVASANARNACPVKTVDLTTIQITNQTSDLTYEWYTSASRSANTQVTNLTAVGAGQYFLFAKSGDCYSSPTVITTDTVSCTSCPTDYSLIVSNNTKICAGDSTKLIASTQLQHAKICYFLTPTGGAPFAIVDSGDPVTVKPSTTTTYYVEVTLNGCESPRTPISVTVTTVPTPMAPTLVKNTCPVKTVDLTTVQIANQTSGLTYEWYTSASRSANTQVTNLTAVGAGQYFLFAKSGDCYSNSTVVTVETVNCVSCPTDYSLIVSKDASICNGDSTGLVASTAVPKAKICWFLTPYGGTPFAIVDSGDLVSVKPTTTTVYYVEVTVDSCESPRKPVVVTVTTVPTPICLGNIKNTCPATTVNLTSIQIENRSTGLTYEWYTSLNRSVATQVTNLSAVGAGKYYLFAKSGNCYSNPTVLTVEIADCNCKDIAGVDVGPGLAVCAGEVIPLKAVLSGSATSVVWASSGTGKFSSPASLTTTYTPSRADLATGNVLLTATTNDPDGPGGVCQSATSTLIAQINKRPDVPVNVACDDTLVCKGNSHEADRLCTRCPHQLVRPGR